MMNRRLPLIPLSVMLALAGCSTPKQSLLRWSPGHADNLTPWDPAPVPTLIVSSQPVDPPAAFTVRSLPERAAAAYITAMAAKAKTPADLDGLVAGPIHKSVDDASTLRRVLVIDVQRNGIRPADRFTRMLVEVKPADRDFRFTDYASASTSNTSISIGSVAITRQVTGSLTLAPTFGESAAPASASTGFTNTNASTHNINETAQLSVNVTPDRVTVLRTGGEGTDLVGNVLVQLSLHAPESALQPAFLADTDLVDKAGMFKTADDARADAVETELLLPRDVWVCARASYVDRIVKTGAETRDEGAQEVAFHEGTLPWAPYLAVGREELEMPLWVVMANDGAVAIETPTGARTLVFTDYEQVQAFRSWLATRKSPTIGHRKLYKGDEHFPLASFGNLKIKRLPAPQASPVPTCAPT